MPDNPIPIEQLRREVAALEEENVLLERKIELEHRNAALKKGLTKPVDITGTIGTMGTQTMEANSPSAGANISAAKTKSRAPFPRALIKRNLSLPEWARAQRKPRLGVEAAKSWVKKPGLGGRPCPRMWADRIAAEFVDEKGKTEVPAVAASWPNGIRED